jgi:hypothetical protein
VLYDRVNTQGYEKPQGDILAVSEMVDDMQEALLEYQVGSEKLHTTVSLKLGRFDRRPSNG